MRLTDKRFAHQHTRTTPAHRMKYKRKHLRDCIWSKGIEHSLSLFPFSLAPHRLSFCLLKRNNVWFSWAWGISDACKAHSNIWMCISKQSIAWRYELNENKKRNNNNIHETYSQTATTRAISLKWIRISAIDPWTDFEHLIRFNWHSYKVQSVRTKITILTFVQIWTFVIGQVRRIKSTM